MLPVIVLSALLVVPAAGDARADQVQIFPSEPRWTVEFSDKPLAPPAASGDRLFLALGSGIQALAIRDKAVLWTQKVVADGPMVATADRVIVPSAGTIVALDAANGHELWKVPVEKITAPIVAHGERLFVAASEHLFAYNLADGSLSWTTAAWEKSLGVVEHRAAAQANWLYVPVADGRIVALDIASGVMIWETDKIGIKPAEPLVAGDRLFAGSEAKHFCSFRLSDGFREWCFEIGAPIVGAPAVDTARVFFVALDNQMWTLDRRSGNMKWVVNLGYRPSAGPTLVGTSVSAPGKTAKLVALNTTTHTPSSQLTLAEELIFPPVFVPATADAPVFLAALYGSLSSKWKLTLAWPPPPILPAMKVETLTAPPGRVVPLSVARAPRE